MADIKNLASTWIMAQKIGVDNIGYEKCSWAVCKLIDMADGEPEKLWEVILAILDLDCSENIIKSVGAGPLEDLFVNYDKEYIDMIEEQASKSNVFKTAMKNVWLDGNDTPLYKRFYDIADTRPPFDK